ncbi:MAG TPA: asparagine--tRNA ligase, partial [Anaerolineales bacterium]|nr:asparagine--tRNA ligase [Anaerolineales bacterium]
LVRSILSGSRPSRDTHDFPARTKWRSRGFLRGFSMKNVYIGDIAAREGQEATLRGWVYNRRSSGKLQFILLRDGTGIIQCVAFKGNFPPEQFEALDRLTQESSLTLTGKVRKDSRAPGGYELDIASFEIGQIADSYPITPKEHGTAFLMEHRHLWLRSSRQHAIIKVRHEIIKACRDYFDDQGFTLVDTPIFTPNACEGTTTLFETEYFDQKAYLTQSGQLYNEATAAAFGKVYCFGPTFRAEKSKTRRHLTEFWMLEPEIAFCDLDCLMEVEEGLITYIVQTVLRDCAAELKFLERDFSKLENIKEPFPRMSYDDAAKYLIDLYEKETDSEKKELLKFEWGMDFGAPHETELTKLNDKPLFVYGYPSAVKAFYMEPWPGRPEVCKSVDLLAPEGYGEICGGSERMSDHDMLLARIRKEGLPEEAFKWYLELRKYGSVPHSGFGMGVERVTAWLCGIEHIREAIPFPRTIKRVYP